MVRHRRYWFFQAIQGWYPRFGQKAIRRINSEYRSISVELALFADKPLPARILRISRDQPHESPFGARDRGKWGLGE